MTLEEEERLSASFRAANPILAALGFDGVRLYPDWGYVVLGGLIVLFLCC
jgi:hypothetical protein